MKGAFSQFKFWFTNSRIQHALPQSFIPAVLAICLAIPYPHFSLSLSLLGVLGVALAHAACNLFDDYFDYRKKDTNFRDELQHKGFRARIGKCPYLTSGATTLNTLLRVTWMLAGLAILIGLIICYYRGIEILFFMGLAGILGFSYSGNPLRLSYRGLGEVLIGIMFGPINMMGMFYVACGTLSPIIVLVSIPIGLLVANIVYVHSILDYEPDKEVGKRTLAVLLDDKKKMLFALALILFIPYAVITYGIIANYLSSYYWLLWLTLPLAGYLFYMMLEYVRNPDRQFTPKIWMGPIDNWNKLKAIGIEWFMIRWTVARNLLASFCIIMIFISIAQIIIK